MTKRSGDLITLSEFKDKFYGEIGTKQRDKLEAGYRSFKAKIFSKKRKTQR